MTQIRLDNHCGLPSLETALSEASLFRPAPPETESFGDHLQRAQSPSAAESGPPSVPATPASEDRPAEDRHSPEVESENNATQQTTADGPAENDPPQSEQTETDHQEQAQPEAPQTEPAAEGEQPAEDPAAEDHAEGAAVETAVVADPPGVEPALAVEHDSQGKAAAEGPAAEIESTDAHSEGETTQRRTVVKQQVEQAAGKEPADKEPAAKQPAAPPEPTTTEEKPGEDRQQAANGPAADRRLPTEVLNRHDATADPHQTASHKDPQHQPDQQGNVHIERTEGPNPTDTALAALAESEPSERPVEQTGPTAGRRERAAGQSQQSAGRAALPEAAGRQPDPQASLPKPPAPQPDAQAPRGDAPQRPHRRGRRSMAASDRLSDRAPQQAARAAPTMGPVSGTEAETAATSGESTDSAAAQKPVVAEVAAKPAAGSGQNAAAGRVWGARPAADPSQAPQPDGQPDPVDRVRFVQRVARAFRAFGGRQGSVRLRLSPPELGSLRLEVSVKNGMMTARVEAETTTARNLLLDNLPALRDRLAQQDVKIEQFQVDLSDRSPGGLPDRTADQPQPRDPATKDGSPQSTGEEDQSTDGPRTPAAAGRPGEGTQLNVVI